MKIKLKDIKQIVEEVVKNALSEQEAPAEPEAAQPAVKQKSDVDVVTKHIQRINNATEYEQLLAAVLRHVPGGNKAQHKLAVKKVFDQLGITSSAVKKVAGE